MGFRVQKKQCASCIYHPESPLDLEKLESQIKDVRGDFNGFRICHHTEGENTACCRGFWNRHKDDFPAGQVAQRLDCVEFVEEDTCTE